MSIDLLNTQVLPKPDVVYDLGNESLGGNLGGISDQLNPSFTGGYAFEAAADTAFFSDVNVWEWTGSAGESFDVVAAGPLGSGSVVTDHPAAPTKFAIKSDVSVNGVTFDSTTGVYTVNIPSRDHVLAVGLFMVAEKTVGGPQAWDLMLLVDGNVKQTVPEPAFTVLNDRRTVEHDFTLQRLDQTTPSTVAIHVRPQAAGPETLRFFEFVLTFSPVADKSSP